VTSTVPGVAKVAVTASAGYVSPCTVAVHQSVCVKGDIEQEDAIFGNVSTSISGVDTRRLERVDSPY
jgi:hypothetical protein